MSDSVMTRLRALGNDFTPEQIVATRDLLAPWVPTPEQVGAVVTRDVCYGPDARHRIDVFTSRESSAPRPVVMYVHGGGFVQGDKGAAGAPFFNNFGAWAVREGFTGITLTYRLAPAFRWPSGGEDLGLAVEWVRRNAAQYGGDPDRIVLTGQSAGATHVATYLAGQGLPAGSTPAIAGAALFSGVFDLTLSDHNELHAAYYGTDYQQYERMSTVAALGAIAVPCLYTISELDPPQFHRQAAAVVSARIAATGRVPELLYLVGHNHVSSVMQLGSPADTLGAPLTQFVRRVSGTND
jgi:acetyl esterase/lipase